MKTVLQEGEVFCKWAKGRFDKNKNLLIAVVGSTGSGKTYASIRMAELHYKYYHNKLMPIEHIVFTIDDLTNLLTSGKLKRGDLIIFEEAGVALSSLEWQNKISKLIGYVFQTFRSENVGIIFTLPSISFLNKTTRVLLHAIYQTAGIDMQRQQVIIRPLLTQYNTMMDKTYYHKHRAYVDGTMSDIDDFAFNKPSQEILIPYEKNKSKFVSSVIKDLRSELDFKKDTTVDDKFLENPIMKDVKELREKGMIFKDIAQYINRKYDTKFDASNISRILKQLKKMGIIIPKYKVSSNFEQETTEKEVNMLKLPSIVQKL